MLRRLFYACSMLYLMCIPAISVTAEAPVQTSHTSTPSVLSDDAYYKSMLRQSRSALMGFIKDASLAIPVTIEEQFPACGITGALHQAIAHTAPGGGRFDLRPMQGLFHAQSLVSPDYIHDGFLLSRYWEAMIFKGAHILRREKYGPPVVATEASTMATPSTDLPKEQDFKSMTMDQFTRYATAEDMRARKAISMDFRQPEALKRLCEQAKNNVIMLSLPTILEAATRVRNRAMSKDNPAPLDLHDYNLLQSFHDQSSHRLVVNLAVDLEQGDYITICAERDKDKRIAVRIADTTFTTDIPVYSEERLQRFVVPLYYAMTNPIALWPALLPTPPIPAAPGSAPAAAEQQKQAAPPAVVVAEQPVGTIATEDHRTIQEAARAGAKERIAAILAEQPQRREACINGQDLQGRIALHEAILGQQGGTVAYLMSTEANVTAYDGEGRTPLHCAAQMGSAPIIKSLVLRGSLIDAPKRAHYRLRRAMPRFLGGSGIDDQEDQTPLHIAALYGHTEAVAILLTHGASVDVRDYYGRSPLHTAVIGGSMPCMTSLLDKKRSLINVPDKTKDTPLYYAIRAGAPAIVHFLCTKGAQVDVKNGNKQTPLAVALATKNCQTVDILLKHNANPNDGSHYLHDLIDDADKDKAVRLAELLLKAKAGANEIFEKKTPLAYALEKKVRDDPMVELLSCYKASTGGAMPAVGVLPDCLKHPVHHAAQHGDIARLEWLSQQQMWPDYSALNSQHQSALHIAAMHGHHIVAHKLCTSFFGDVHSVDSAGYTPLHYAAERGHLDTVKVLIEQQARLDIQDASGETPLHKAVKNGHERVVALLLEKKAACNIACNGTEMTPLHYAAQGGYQAIVALLMRHGADKEALNGAHKTPFYCAAETGHEAVVQLLLQRGATVTVVGDLPKPLRLMSYQRAAMQSILQHKVMTGQQKALCEEITGMPEVPALAAQLFMNEEAIVDRHRSPSLAFEELLSIGLPYAQAVLPGMSEALIVPSLRQQRSNGEMTGYCAYYALFNAKTFIDKTNCMDRKAFTEDFMKNLEVIKKAGAKPPYDFLDAQQLRLLVAEFCGTKDKPFPIAVVSIDHLLALTKISDPALALEINTIAEHKDLQHIHDFIRGRINEIVIIFGSRGCIGDHWSAVHIFRGSRGEPLHMYMADSIVGVLHKELHNRAILEVIAPCYCMLTNPIDTWHKIFTPELLSISDSRYQLEQVIAGDSNHNGKERALALLDLFAESIIRLQSSMRMLASSVRQHYMNNSMKLIFSVQLRDFETIAQELRFTIAENKMLSEDGASRRFAASIAETVPMTAQGIQRLVDILQLPPMYDAIHTILSGLLSMIPDQRDFLRGVVAQEQQDTAYNTIMAPLPRETIDFILQYINQDALRILGYLKEPRTTQTAILLYGPPGNGKTTLGRALAQFYGRDFYCVRTAGLGTQYQFSREHQLQAIEKYMQDHKNAVVLFDEIDALVSLRQDGDNALQVLQGIMDYAKEKYPNVVFIGTTNIDPLKDAEDGEKQLPPAIRSRFGQNTIHIGNPSDEHRAAIINRELAKLTKEGISNEVSLGKIHELIKNTHKFSIRDIESIFTVVRQSMCSEDGYRSLVEVGITPVFVNKPDEHQAKILTDTIVDKAYAVVYETIKTRFGIRAIWRKIMGVSDAALPYIQCALSVFQTIDSHKNAEASRQQAERFHHESTAAAREASTRSALTAGFSAGLSTFCATAATGNLSLAIAGALTAGFGGYCTASCSQQTHDQITTGIATGAKIHVATIVGNTAMAKQTEATPSKK